MILFASELTKQERERRVRLVKMGEEGEFWKTMRSEIDTLVKIEDAYLDSFKEKGLTEMDRDQYNRSVGRCRTLKEILSMPKVIVASQESFLKRIAKQAKSVAKQYFSLVEK